MVNVLARKLSYGADLDGDDLRMIETMTAQTRRVPAGVDVISDGERPETVKVVMSGYAYRFKELASGTRGISALLVPGDVCDLHVALLGRMDHGIRALTACDVAYLSQATLERVASEHPRITRALWWATLVDEATLRAWLVNVGGRPADKAMAHFFSEMHVRLAAIGMVHTGAYSLPLTQEQLGEALGLSTVHVNRTIQGLRAAELLDMRAGEVRIEDVERLKAYCGFDPSYLHLDYDWRT